MSEDQQKQPESADDKTQTPPTPYKAGSSGTGLKKTTQTAESTRNRKQPFLKAQSIKVLRGTIGLLEGVVEKLETEPVTQIPPAVPPSTTSLRTPVLDTTAVTPQPEPVSSASEPVVTAPVSDIPTVVPEIVEQKPEPASKRVLEPAKPKLTDRILPSFHRVEAFWDATLRKVRSLLPQAWNEKLSDWGLTGAIATIVVVLLVTTAALIPETPAQVAKAPPNTINAPPELKAPEPPQPVEVEPPPTPELTPEQSLISSIQNQVAEVTQQYGNGLIQSIEANFLASRLIVKVSNGWYDLKESQQNKLADEILRRSKGLDFSKLEITDLKGTIVARSPVVGPNMVILQRQELAANT